MPLHFPSNEITSQYFPFEAIIISIDFSFELNFTDGLIPNSQTTLVEYFLPEIVSVRLFLLQTQIHSTHIYMNFIAAICVVAFCASVCQQNEMSVEYPMCLIGGASIYLTLCSPLTSVVRNFGSSQTST